MLCRWKQGRPGRTWVGGRSAGAAGHRAPVVLIWSLAVQQATLRDSSQGLRGHLPQLDCKGQRPPHADVVKLDAPSCPLDEEGRGSVASYRMPRQQKSHGAFTMCNQLALCFPS